MDYLELQTIPFPPTLAMFKFCHLLRKRTRKEALVTSRHSSLLRGTRNQELTRSRAGPWATMQQRKPNQSKSERFIFSTLFFAQSEKVKSIRGRIVVIVWLFVILIVTSSYTASLTLLLTVDQLKPDFQGISEVLASDVPIGFQAGSHAGEYLNKLGVTKDRLVPLKNVSSYTKMLFKGPKAGGVGAIVDDLPYAQLFLSSECEFRIYYEKFTSSGWGFAFQKGSKLTVDVSSAILGLEENGELQRINDKWFGSSPCDSIGSTESNQLGLDSFWGLFLVTGLISVTSVVLYIFFISSQMRSF